MERARTPRRRLTLVGLVLAGAVAFAGVDLGPSGPLRSGPSRAQSASYWTAARLLAATPFQNAPLRAVRGISRVAPVHPFSLRVGALFVRGAGGDHFCTASVVDSPDRDLLITAAHCLHEGKGGGYRSDVVFVPGYRDGRTPYGIWTPTHLLVAPQWVRSSDPNYDVGFVVLKPEHGRTIESVLGGNRLQTDSDFHYLVRVTGYPSTESAPITCTNWTKRQSSSQLRFDCSGFTEGTSGSPWVTHFSPRTHTGTIVGVIGGYQQGGDIDSISYSSRFGAGIERLYSQAKSLSP